MAGLIEMEDAALMLRARAGDMDAFEAIHARYQPRLLHFFWMLSRNEQTAAELCQETFLRVWRVRLRYRATGSFAGYLFAIARLIWLERCRVLSRDARLGRSCPADEAQLQACPGGEPRHVATERDLRAHIGRALDELPEEQRIVFVMRSVEGLSLDEIAEALDCPINTVRSRKILAVKKLRHLLAHIFVELYPQGQAPILTAEDSSHGMPTRTIPTSRLS